MKYNNIKKAVFLKRPNRFIAEVEVDGIREVVHVKNTGRCRELLIPGAEVWLTAPGTPNRKTRYDLVAVRKTNGILFNIDSQAPNKVVKEWLDNQNYTKVISEYTYGNSRIDFYMENIPITTPNDNSASYNTQKYLMEVKGCTLEIEGIGYFPDAPTERGVKHIRELIKAKDDGFNAALAFVIQMEGVTAVHPNVEMHPEFGLAMDEAKQAGVDILFYCCQVEPDSLEIVKEAKSI